MTSARFLAVLLSVAAALILAACGEDEQPAQSDEQYQSVNAQLAETEGIYLDIDELKYQVQMSRQLNTLREDDREFLIGVSDADRSLSREEEWFGVWLRVENPNDDDRPNAVDFEIRDTQENVYRPVQIGPDNVFAYRAAEVEGESRYPDPQTAAGERPPYGAFLLFKLRRFSLDNRPLELVITGRNGQQGIVNLDV
jgi:hypothetical protein